MRILTDQSVQGIKILSSNTDGVRCQSWRLGSQPNEHVIHRQTGQELTPQMQNLQGKMRCLHTDAVDMLIMNTG